MLSIFSCAYGHSLEKCLFKSLPIFCNWLVLLLLSCIFTFLVQQMTWVKLYLGHIMQSLTHWVWASLSSGAGMAGWGLILRRMDPWGPCLSLLHLPTCALSRPFSPVRLQRSPTGGILWEGWTWGPHYDSHGPLAFLPLWAITKDMLGVPVMAQW